MTANRRIFLNIAATYGRSLYSILCGLFTGRWTLMMLGDVDYGLYSVVCGLAVFIAFFNGIMASAVGRFYAYAVGRASVSKDDSGIDECRRWFNVAVCVHTVVPLALIAVGYPLGVWAIGNWLNIPPDRVGACIWVFRFVCLTTFVGMMNVPFSAMYNAKQEIAELTLYSFASTTVNTVCVYYMVSHPGDWLTAYAAVACMISVVPHIIIGIRALMAFPECRIIPGYFLDFVRMRELTKFAGWQFFGNFGYLVRTQGLAILVNKLFGAAYNATLGISATVTSHTGTLSSALNAGFFPAITNLEGAGKREQMIEYTLRACKIGTALCLVFVMPLSLEISYVLQLWLKKPPVQVAPVCVFTLWMLVLEEMTRGIGIAVTAVGRIAKYYVVLGSLNILSIPIIWAAVSLGGAGFLWVFAILLAVTGVATVLRVWIAKGILQYSVKSWVREVCMPLCAVSAIVCALGALPRFVMEPSFLRLCVTTALTVPLFAVCCHFLVLTKREREFLLQRIGKRLGRTTA